MKIFKYFFKQVLNNRSFTLLFIANLSLGLCGFITLDIFKNSIDGAFKSRAKVILGADFGLSSRRPINAKESNLTMELAGADVEKSSMVEIYSMVAGPSKKSRLVQIKAIDEKFPFYGEIKLQLSENSNQDALMGESQKLTKAPIAWLYPELLRQLEVEVGEDIKVGEKFFKVQAIIKNDSGQGISTSMAPRIYIGLNYLKQTELIQFGTVAWYSQVFKTAKLNENDLKSLKIQLGDRLQASDLKIYTDQDASEQTSRLLAYLNDFLGLASVATLFLAFVGGVFLFRSYLAGQMKTSGILLSLGLTFKQNFFYQLFILFLLGLVSASLAILMGVALLPALQMITKELLPLNVVTEWNRSSLLTVFGLGGCGALFIGLPLMVSIRKLKPKILFSDNRNIQQKKIDAYVVLSFLPSLLLIWSLAVWQANSFKIGSLFTFAFLLSALLLAFFAYLLTKIFVVPRTKKMGLRWGARDLIRFKTSSITIFLCLGLGMLLINLIPQVKASLDHELSMPGDSRLPSFFMFDIQQEQLSLLSQMAQAQKISLQQLSPMVRARLIKINEESFVQRQIRGEDLSREQQRQQQSRNRGYNLSYRQSVGIGENIVEGKAFSGVYDDSSNKLAEISVEQRFAERLNIGIGDVLQFDIQGVSLKGVIVNLRSVRWTTFQPNFFILFQPGVLDDAPKTFLASVPKLSVKNKQSFQDSVVEKLPNVSIIDVSRLVEKLKSIVQQMGFALQFMTFICLCAGFVVLFSIANFQARRRSWDIALLKSLGASFFDIKAMFQWQFFILSLVSSLFGIGFSLVFSFFFSKLLFETTWVVNWYFPIGTLLLILLITYGVTHFATKNFLSIRAAKLLGQAGSE